MRNIRLKSMKEEEVGKYEPVFQCVYDLFQSFDGVFYKLFIDGKEYLLQRVKNLFALYTIEIVDEQPVVGYEMFTVDEDYKVDTAGFDNFEMHTIDGDRCIQDRDSYNIESLICIKRSDGVDIDGYDGSIGYIQYNQEYDVRLMLIYQQMHNGKDEVHGYQANKMPFQILVERGLNAKQKGGIIPVRTSRYLKVNIRDDENPLAYNMCAIREYGLTEFLMKGAFSLHKDNRITRYYKITSTNEEGYARTTYPLGTGYRLEGFEELFSKYGFKKNIPDNLIKIHNGTYEDLNTFEEIATVVGKFEKDNTKDVTKLVLTFGGVIDGTDN